MPAHDSVHLSHELRLEQAPHSLLLKRVLEAGLPIVRTEAWATSGTSLAPIGEPELRVSAEGHEQALFRLDGEVVHVGVYPGHAYCSVAAADEETALARVRRLRELLPAPDPSSSHDVNVTFWTYGPHGPQPGLSEDDRQPAGFGG